MKTEIKIFKKTDTVIFNDLEIKSGKKLAYVNDDFMNNKITIKDK